MILESSAHFRVLGCRSRIQAEIYLQMKEKVILPVVWVRFAWIALIYNPTIFWRPPVAFPLPSVSCRLLFNTVSEPMLLAPNCFSIGKH